MKIAAFLSLLLLASPAARAESTIRIWTLSNRSVSETVPMVRSLLAPDEQVWAEERNGKLVVKASAEHLQKVDQLLKQLDVASAQVQLTVTQSGTQALSQVGGGVTVLPDGRVVGAAGAGSANGSVNETQTLVVMSGGTGYIVTGENIPTVSPYTSYAQSVGLLPPGVLVQSVTTGFAVEPIVVGDVVRLNITPWMSYLGAGGPGQVKFSQSSTTITLHNGDSAQIGAGSAGGASSSAAFGLVLGGSTQSSSNTGSVTVQANIMAP